MSGKIYQAGSGKAGLLNPCQCFVMVTPTRSSWLEDCSTY